MPPLQVDFVREIKASLTRLVEGGQFAKLYTRPIGKNQAPEFPYLELRLGSDDKYEPKSKPGYAQWAAHSRVYVIIAAAQVEESGIEDLAALAHLVRSRIAADAQNFTNKSITIRSAAQPQDPDVSALIGDLLGTIIEIQYSGLDYYP